MLLLKVISRLLDYPTPELFKASAELCSVVQNDPNLSIENKTAMIDFIEQLTSRDLYDAQESYDLLFDRGRALSLLLFEHVHGESRDRGQAMVNLLNVYQSKGFEAESSQLPDYIPLYLEFLSEQPQEYVEEWLGDICHLMTLLSERLIDRECYYSVLFDALIEISGQLVSREEIAEAVKKEQPDDTIEAIDKEWEDKEIKFNDPIPAGQCSSSGNYLDQNTEVPIKWHEAENAKSSETIQNSRIYGANHV